MKKLITLGQIDLSFHKVAAAVFQRMLLHLGYQVEMVTAPHAEMFQLQQQGKVDLLISAWLPGSHGAYLSAYEEQVTKFTPIYTPYCVWCVPNYIPESQISCIDDLKKPENLQEFEREINGIGMGAGISRFSVEMLSAYSLADYGYTFLSNDFDVFTRIVELKLLGKKRFVIPIWHPQYLHEMFSLRALEEPKHLLRGVDEATPILLKSSSIKLEPRHQEILSKIVLGNDAVSDMDYRFSKQKKAALEAADSWINDVYGDVDRMVQLMDVR